MTLDEYMIVLRARMARVLDAFEKNWRDRAANDNENGFWPMSLANEAEWDEQFDAFVEPEDVDA